MEVQHLRLPPVGILMVSAGHTLARICLFGFVYNQINNIIDIFHNTIVWYFEKDFDAYRYERKRKIDQIYINGKNFILTEKKKRKGKRYATIPYAQI